MPGERRDSSDELEVLVPPDWLPRSEPTFWRRFSLLLAAIATFAAAGVWQVQRRSAGVKTAYELSRSDVRLREELEANRRLEAELSARRDPNALRGEAAEAGMVAPPPDGAMRLVVPPAGGDEGDDPAPGSAP